jgi:hypothetical protein
MNGFFRVLSALALTTVLVPAPAMASIRVKPGAFKLDAKMGHVLVRVGPTFGKKQKAPNLYIWRYDAARNEIRTTKKNDPAKIAKGEDASAYFGDRVYQGGEKVSTFITSLTPGEYIIHGSESTCLCLGTYRFTVKAGEITDIGTVLIANENGVGSGIPELAGQTASRDLLERPFAISDAIFVRAASEGDVVPQDVQAVPRTRAALTPDVRFVNRGPTRYLYPAGLLVNRAVGLPAPIVGDMKTLVDRIVAEADEKEVSVTPKLEEDAKKPNADGETKVEPASPAKSGTSL